MITNVAGSIQKLHCRVKQTEQTSALLQIQLKAAISSIDTNDAHQRDGHLLASVFPKQKAFKACKLNVISGVIKDPWGGKKERQLQVKSTG